MGRTGKQPPIIYYKLQGEKDEEGNLKEEDFMIVIKSEMQRYLKNLAAKEYAVM